MKYVPRKRDECLQFMHEIVFVLGVQALGDIQFIQNVFELPKSAGEVWEQSLWPSDPRKLGDWCPSTEKPTRTPFFIKAKAGGLDDILNFGFVRVEYPIFTPTDRTVELFSYAGGLLFVTAEGLAVRAEISGYDQMMDRALCIPWVAFGLGFSLSVHQVMKWDMPEKHSDPPLLSFSSKSRSCWEVMRDWAFLGLNEFSSGTTPDEVKYLLPWGDGKINFVLRSV